MGRTSVSSVDKKSTPAWRSRSWWTGFRVTMGAGLAATCSVLIANLVLLGWSTTKPDSGVGTRVLYQGDCSSVAARSTVAHLIINVLGTLLLATSNAAMQALTAPTREDLNVAHAKGDWLAVGVGSMHNFTVIGSLRQIAWFALLLSSLPLHLLYNSVIIQSTSASQYYAILTTQDFSHGVPINTQAYNATSVTQGATNLSLLRQIQNESTSYSNLSLADCLATYGPPFVNGRTNVILVSNIATWEDAHTNSSVLFSAFYSPNITEFAYSLFSYTSVFQDDSDGYIFQPYVLSNGTIPYEEGWLTSPGDSLPQQTFKWVHVDYCLSKEVEGVCTVELHQIFLIVVIVCNAFKIFCFVWLSTGVFPLYPLLTVGDALASFLTDPDPYTEGGFALSLFDGGAVNIRMLKFLRSNGRLVPESRKRWFNKRSSWSAAKADWQRGMFTFVTLAWIIFAIVGFIEGMKQNGQGAQPSVSLAELWANGFGNVYPSEVFSFTLQWTVTENILFANAPQLLVSIIYLWFNQTISQMHAAYETSCFVSKRSGLRVSYDAHGSQRSSYWLSLPIYYAVPLMSVSAILHWALSQSLFLAEIVIQSPDGDTLPPSDRINGVGYSLVGILIVFLIGAMMILFLFIYGKVRRLPPGIPILGSCSLAISAACHGHSDRPDEAQQSLQYGVVQVTGEEAGRVGFSSEEVEPLQNGWAYDGEDSAIPDRSEGRVRPSGAAKPLLTTANDDKQT